MKLIKILFFLIIAGSSVYFTSEDNKILNKIEFINDLTINEKQFIIENKDFFPNNYNVALSEEKIILISKKLNLNKDSSYIYLNILEIDLTNNIQKQKLIILNTIDFIDTTKYPKFKDNNYAKNHFYCSDVCYDNRKLYLLTQFRLIIISFSNERELKSNKSITLDKFYKYIKKINNSFILSTPHPMFTKDYKKIPAPYVSIFDHNFNHDTTISFEKPYGKEWLHFTPRKIMDFNDNFIIISDITRYQIKVINLKNKQLNYVINFKPKEWFVDKIKNNNESLNNLRNKLDRVCLITKVNLIDNKLIVFWTSPGDDKYLFDYHFDVWELKQNSYSLLYQNLDNYKPEEEQLMKVDYIRINNEYDIVKNKLINYVKIPLKINSKDSLKYKSYQDSLNNYISQKGIKYSIIISDLSL